MSQTQSVSVAARIRRDIIGGRFPFGTRLTLGQLEELYETGQMPVREALRQLQGEGLVEVSPNRGARVRRIDTSFIANLFDIRVAIEAMLTRRAAERATSADIEKLATAAASYEATNGSNPEDVLSANRAFHTIVNEIASNAEATEILRRNEQLISALWHRHGYGPLQKEASQLEHRQILTAIRLRDPDSAACFAMAHAARAKLDLLARLSD